MVDTNFTEAVASIASYVATLCKMCSFLVLHRVSEKTVQNCFYQIFVKFPSILITFGR